MTSAELKEDARAKIVRIIIFIMIYIIRLHSMVEILFVFTNFFITPTIIKNSDSSSNLPFIFAFLFFYVVLCKKRIWAFLKFNHNYFEIKTICDIINRYNDRKNIVISDFAMIWWYIYLMAWGKKCLTNKRIDQITYDVSMRWIYVGLFIIFTNFSVLCIHKQLYVYFHYKIKYLSHSALAKLPGKHTTCLICLDTYKKEEIITQLKCEHHFHLNCLRKWSQTSERCPLCRKNIKLCCSLNIEKFM